MAYTVQQSTARAAGKCKAVTCCGLDDPLANYSADHDELDSFISVGFSDFYQALGIDCEGQPCTVSYESSISQADADAQAALAALQCSIATCEDPDGEEVELFYNQEVSCSTGCPSGGYVTTIVPAGLYYGTSQEEADGIALGQCSVQAFDLAVCMVGSFAGCCVGAEYNSSVSYSLDNTIADANLTTGSLPPGLSFTFDQNAVIIVGTPTTCGTYEFSITIVDSAGNTGTREFSIIVLEISTTSPLPELELNEPYALQLEACGGSGEYKWELDSGSLPDGLTLYETGLISGTPTTSGDFNFTVKVTDGQAADQPPVEPTDEPQPVALYAYFAFIPSFGSRPTTVDFQDQSIGEAITAWFWDFGDGATSTERNPSHEYNDDGTAIYSVTLTVFNGSISDTISRHLPFGKGRIRVKSFVKSDWSFSVECFGHGDYVNEWNGEFKPNYSQSGYFGYLPTWNTIETYLFPPGETGTRGVYVYYAVVKDVNAGLWRMYIQQYWTPTTSPVGPFLWYGEKIFVSSPDFELASGLYVASNDYGDLCIPVPSVEIEYY